MISVELVNAEQVTARLDAIPAVVLDALQTKIRTLAIDLADYIRRQKLQGQVLGHRSGALERSIQSDASTSGQVVTGEVFSSGDVKYAAIHEYGGTIPAHDILPSKAQALAFMIDGKQVFAKVVHMPAVKMPERSFMRTSLAENREHIVEGITETVNQAAAKALNP